MGVTLKRTFKFRSFLFAMVALGLILVTLAPLTSMAQDPTGAQTGTIKDLGTDTLAVTKDTALNKVIATVNTIGNADGHNRIATNIMWTLITGFLVMFMQAGFALVETGFTQKKNVAHTMAMNFLIYGLGMFGFWVCGFAFMFGGGLNAATLGGAPGVIPHEYAFHLGPGACRHRQSRRTCSPCPLDHRLRRYVLPI